MAQEYFAYSISNELDLSGNYPNNLAELIFARLETRGENSMVLLSHDNTRYVEVSLSQFRHIIFSLYNEFNKKHIRRGDTVLLATLTGNNELYIALMFAALTSFGARVLLPMFLETTELTEWLKESKCQFLLIPEQDIFSLQHHDKEKSVVKKIRKIAKELELSCYDIFSDFRIKEFLFATPLTLHYAQEELYQEIVGGTSFQTESLLITTSGSTGKSKLVTYCQGAYISSCISWQKAGFFSEDLLGGRCFTPMFAHTMGIRSFFNALWTGRPVCIINSEWFLEKPETVRYLLLKMQPEHITGGPSIYNLFLELMRCFPELKSKLSHSFKTLISSGAPIDRKTIEEIETCFGLKIFNAFGTTETQQILSSLLHSKGGKLERMSLGAPLPGVKIGLKRLQGEQDLYELYVNSVFGMKRGPGTKDQKVVRSEYFCTGDIVRIKEDKLIFYAGRENKDFIKDGFGVKIPVEQLHNYYETLCGKTVHVEFLPVKGYPGLAALIFLKLDEYPGGVICNEKQVQEYSGLIAEVNNRLLKTVEPFEYRHRSIIRFTLINSDVPRTIKGNISLYKLRNLYEEEINNLIEPLGCHRYVKNVETMESQDNLYTHYHNSYYGKMMLSVAIDYSYHKSKKDSLFTMHGMKEIEILDFTGGFGVNLLGHNNERINQAAVDFIQNNEIPISDQGSIQRYSGILAEKLNLMMGSLTHKDFNVVFGSTGSEAVEVAIHHAFLEWEKAYERMRKMQFKRYGSVAGKLVKKVWESNIAILSACAVYMLCLKDSFHGHSTGARALLGNTQKREKFKNILGVKSIFIDDNDEDWKNKINLAIESAKIKLQKVTWKKNEYMPEEFDFPLLIGAIIEPIIGEGGIRKVNPKFLQHLSNYDFPLIMDEIQCGLGRAGSLLASKGIKADYYLFAKALGGNVEKISAVLIDKNRYVNDFPDFYSSTFANGGLASRIALESLSIIEEENILAQAKEKGDTIRKKLNAVMSKYPNVIHEITGIGLMQGIRFCDFSRNNKFILRCLYNEKYFGLLLSACMLLKHRIRILPSISSPNVLRVEPSAYITDNEINKLVFALEDLCENLENNRMYDLLRPLMDNDPFSDNKGKKPDIGPIFTGLEEPLPNAKKVGIIAHFVYPNDELRALDKDLCDASDTGLRILSNRFQTLMQAKPFLLFSKNIMCGKIHLSFIALAIDSSELEKRIRRRKQGKIIEKIQDAVYLANRLGINTVSLGAYTSIISNNGLSLVEPEGTRIITGNTLTAASGICRLKKEIEARWQANEKRALGIVGASGNIGSILTHSFLKSELSFEKIFLFGRSTKRISETIFNIDKEIKESKDHNITITADLNQLQNCNVIIVATNTNAPIIFPHHIQTNEEVIISDLSVPKAVSGEVNEMNNVVPVNFASYIKLREEPDFIISSHTPKGTVFCCAAEAILNGLEQINSTLKGKITTDGVEEVTQLAQKYYFFDEMAEAVNTKRI